MYRLCSGFGGRASAWSYRYQRHDRIPLVYIPSRPSRMPIVSLGDCFSAVVGCLLQHTANLQICGLIRAATHTLAADASLRGARSRPRSFATGFDSGCPSIAPRRATDVFISGKLPSFNRPLATDDGPWCVGNSFQPPAHH